MHILLVDVIILGLPYFSFFCASFFVGAILAFVATKIIVFELYLNTGRQAHWVGVGRYLMIKMSTC